MSASFGRATDLRCIGALILCLLLTGCGFHLRTWDLDANVSSARVTAEGRNALEEPLRRNLRSSGVELVEEDAHVTIALLSEQRSRRSISVTDQARAAEYETSLGIQYEIRGGDGRVLLAPSWIRARGCIGSTGITSSAAAKSRRCSSGKWSAIWCSSSCAVSTPLPGRRPLQLKPAALARQLGAGLAPIYLISGDETLLVEEACDAVLAAARAQGYSERSVQHVEADFKWHDLLQDAASMSLFAQRRIIDVRNPGAKFDKDASEMLRDIPQIRLPGHAAADQKWPVGRKTEIHCLVQGAGQSRGRGSGVADICC